MIARAALALALLAGPAAAQVTGTARIHDADTLTIDRQAYRLAGIDGPELNTPFGRGSRDMLISLIGGQPVTCRATGARSYDRLVAVCGTRAIPDLGAALVARGWALDCRHYSGGRYRALEPAGARGYLPQAGYCVR